MKEITNLEKIENIKSPLNSLRGVNPKGKLLEAQSKTQIIIAEELIEANKRLCNLGGILESIDLMIRQRK